MLLAYSMGCSSIVGTGATVEDVIAAARKTVSDDPLTDSYLVIFDVADKADFIANPMQSNRIYDNLRPYPIVWRGENQMAQEAFKHWPGLGVGDHAEEWRAGRAPTFPAPGM